MTFHRRWRRGAGRAAVAVGAWIALLAPLAACNAERPVQVDGVVDPGVEIDCTPALACRDNDPCTDDFPDFETCTCTRQPRDAVNACLYDWHCDDDDPCTIDSCEVDDCALQRCHHVRLDRCDGCFDGCDDGNACTIDACGPDATFCVTTPEPLCEPRCDLGLAQPVGILGGTKVPGETTVVGHAAALDCGGADVCDCDTALVLAGEDGGSPLTLQRAAGAPWRCTIANGCGAPTIDCAPLVADLGYVVFGHAQPASPDGTVVLDVDGWCFEPLFSRAAAVLGGTLRLDAGPTLTFTATIDENALTISISEPRCSADCVDGTALPAQLVDIFEDDGRSVVGNLRVELGGEARFGRIVLFPQPSGLAGHLSLRDGSDDGLMTLQLSRALDPSGTMPP
ncbi:MAG: hypothetical protein U1F43_02730 [Myxococcota bacterium]